MTDRDEPLSGSAGDDGVEEVSPDLIIDPGETLAGAVPTPGTEPSETSRSWSDASAPTARPAFDPFGEPDSFAESEAEARPKPVARLTPAKPMPSQRAAAAPELQQEPPRLDEASTRVVIVPKDTAPRPRPSKLLAFVTLLLGLGAGFYGGMRWERLGGLGGLGELLAERGAKPAPVRAPPPEAREAAEDEERLPSGETPAPAKPKRNAKPAKAAPAARTARAAPAAEPAEKGTLSVTAPAAAEVFLDGKRIGKGSLKADVAPGRHRIEVKLGKSKVGETFVSEPGITWTYQVTPGQ